MKLTLLKKLKIILLEKCWGNIWVPLKKKWLTDSSDLGGVFGFFLGLSMINCAEYFLCKLPTKVYFDFDSKNSVPIIRWWLVVNGMINRNYWMKTPATKEISLNNQIWNKNHCLTLRRGLYLILKAPHVVSILKDFILHDSLYIISFSNCSQCAI